MPFLYHYDVGQQKFEIFFCFINIEAFGNIIKKDDYFYYQMNKYCIEYHKIEFYERMNEPINFKGCTE